MKTIYNSYEQIRILKNCNNACELLTAREILEESNVFSNTALLFYNMKMSVLLFNNKISA